VDNEKDSNEHGRANDWVQHKNFVMKSDAEQAQRSGALIIPYWTLPWACSKRYAILEGSSMFPIQAGCLRRRKGLNGQQENSRPCVSVKPKILPVQSARDSEARVSWIVGYSHACLGLSALLAFATQCFATFSYNFDDSCGCAMSTTILVS
jgi:hypothetical protein